MCLQCGSFVVDYIYAPHGSVRCHARYWDGNGFSGPLPSSIGRAKLVSRVSFNINNFSGAIPPGICDIPAGDGPDTPDVDHDCRIGADTDLDVYQV